MPCLLVAASSWLTAACTSDAGPAPVDPADVACGEPVELSSQTPLPDDVDAVLELRCRKCHDRPRQNFAPMSLVTWEDFHAASNTLPMQPVYEFVQERIHSENYPMPPIREPRLEPDEVALLDGWLDDCAPPADAP